MHFLPLIPMLLLLQGPQIPDQHLPKPPAPGAVLAKVNGVEIKASDVEPLLWDWRGYEVMQDLISYQLVRGEAHKKGVGVTELEVLKALDDHMKQFQESQPQGDVDAMMRASGFPKSRLYLRVKTDMLLERLAEKDFDASKFVKTSTMLFEPKSASATDLSEALQRANAAAERLRKGESWEVVLKDTQSNKGLIDAKGMIGWRELSAFPEPARSEIVKGAAGTVTQPVHTGAGIQLFRVEIKGQNAKAEDLQELKEQYAANARNFILNRIRTESKIERFYGPKEVRNGG